ncbi:hypothetical protein AAMO2058_000928400 [Amorphochlora amoebiformis]
MPDPRLRVAFRYFRQNCTRRWITVKNTGSVARDHLANERTFLAWARTGMAFVGLEQDKQKLLDERTDTTAANFVMVCIGGGFLTYATYRYFSVQKALMIDKFPVNKHGVIAIVSGSSVITLAGLTILFAPEKIEELVGWSPKA